MAVCAVYGEPDKFAVNGFELVLKFYSVVQAGVKKSITHFPS